jgi:hypothetical protein
LEKRLNATNVYMKGNKDFKNWEKIKSNPEDILKNRREGIIYCGDFSNNKGRYISSILNSSDIPDIVLNISPKIEIRCTYIFTDEQISGIQISKLNTSGRIDKINLSKFDWEKIQKLLYIFDDIDIKSIATGSLLLDKSINLDSEVIKKFIKTISLDNDGKIILEEIIKSLNYIDLTSIKEQNYRIQNADLLGNLLNDSFFENYKKVVMMIFLGYILHAMTERYKERLTDKLQNKPMIVFVLIFFVFVFISSEGGRKGNLPVPIRGKS